MSTRNFEALDTDDVAALLGVTERQVRTYIADKGLPCKMDGRKRTFNWPEVLAWYVEWKASQARYTGGDPSEGKRSSRDADRSSDPIYRRDSANASLKEIDLAQRQGKLVNMADVLNVFNAVTKGMQIEIRGLPNRILGQVLAIRDRDEMNAFLTDETNHVLERMAALRFDGTELPEQDEPDADE